MSALTSYKENFILERSARAGDGDTHLPAKSLVLDFVLFFVSEDIYHLFMRVRYIGTSGSVHFCNSLDIGFRLHHGRKLEAVAYK